MIEPVTRSREIDVVSDPTFARAVEQTKQGGTFGDTRATPDQNDEPDMRFGLGQAQEITTIASDDNHPPAGSVAQSYAIVRSAGQHLIEDLNRVALQAQNATHVRRNVVVQKKIHPFG